MRKTLVWLFILMVAVIIGGCSSGSDDPTYSVKGAIVDDNGSAVAGATVTLNDGSGASGAVAAGAAVVATTTTDANGSYTFAGIDPGDYTITPTKEGYIFVPGNLAVTVSNADVDLSTDDTKKFAARKDTDDSDTASGFLHYTLPNQYKYEQDGGLVANEAATLFATYTLSNGITYDYGTDGIADTADDTLISGYKLDQFVDKTTVNAATPDPDGVLGANDARKLYSIVIRSNQDGFSNRTKFYDNGTKTESYNADLRWDQFEKGYLLDLNYSGKTFFEATLAGEFMKMFNTKYAYDLYMFRKIDVKRPDAAGSLATFEIAATTDSYVDDTNFTDSNGGLTTTKFTIETMSFGAYTNVKAISLDQFLTAYVTDKPGSYTYKIVALDGTYKEGWTYANMQQAYYLPDFDLIIQVDASNAIVSNTKINFPVRIELIGSSVEYDYSAANPPAYAKAYDE